MAEEDRVDGKQLIVKEHTARVLLDDWDGTTSGWLDLGGDKPIKGIAFTGIDTTPDITFQVAFDSSGTHAAAVLKADGTVLTLASVAATAYRFMTEFGPARFIQVTATETQVDAKIIGYFAS